MNVSEYRDELDGLRYAINSFKSAVNFEERTIEASALSKKWRRIALMTQPKRMSAHDKAKCDSLWKEAVDILNKWAIESSLGPPEHEDRPQPSAKAMADTMKFCNAMKRVGFA